ncbi:hypothetical protein SMACR_08937 [Sordaria macrospora]|uniref:Uncharacterized protein n=1 Tax=Sordaria macrospora TaxID=5147 RepID=A0A8S8ZJX1_SORMA|nr:hypothetical protein SMACR_08937 [Sordaria macrospora]KAH7629327.1 hypothetical protein B0T09DRAFT_342797 [Sordaria sp. MPI-SDFR-AT-0083]WPJ63932.1 hypothetical protein SMAC4_08937 [Sordaria macrospora]
MSAQQPTDRPQPPKSEGYRQGQNPSSKPTTPRYSPPNSQNGSPLNSAPGTPGSVSSLSGYPVPPGGPQRMYSENAVSDTPLTSDPYGTPAGSGGAQDYMSYRRPTNAQSQLPTAELRNNLNAARAVGGASVAMGASGAGAWGSSRGIIGASGPANPREARETQYVSRNNSTTGLNGMGGQTYNGRGHPLRENMQSEARTEGEQMATYGEGEVADAVEGQARKRNEGRNRRESTAQGGRPNLSLAQVGEGEIDHHGRERIGSASHREVSGERHGRVRGEVSLEPSEADLERKKLQQSWKREEIKKARKAGKDVDGTSGLGGREPRPEV